MNKRKVLLYIRRWWMWITFIVILSAIMLLWPDAGNKQESLTAAMGQINAGQVQNATINTDADSMTLKLRGGHTYAVTFPKGYEADLTRQLVAKRVDFKTKKSHPNIIATIFSYWWVVWLVWMIYWMRSATGGISNLIDPEEDAKAETPTVRFKDVRGADEAIELLQQVVDSLRNPQKYEGVKTDRGFIFHGPTGTGKTMLARAVAGEAGVPFYYLSGASLTSMFGGGTTRKVNSFFNKVEEGLATTTSPAVVFIDEIDGLAQRRAGGSGVDRDSNSAVTALLHRVGVLLDRFPNVVLIAATNRLTSLDDALTREGRLGRHISMPNPDQMARWLILQDHTTGKQLGDDVDLRAIASLTGGMNGAKLAAVMDEAARVSFMEHDERRPLSQADIQEAVVRLAVGIPRKSAKVHKADTARTAAHEAGHAVIALLSPEVWPQYVTIIPVADSGGSTWSAVSDRHMLTRESIMWHLAQMLGGRAAEQQLCKDHGIGVSHDLDQATRLALQAVCEWSMGTLLRTVDLENWEDDPQADIIRVDVEVMLQEAFSSAKGKLDTNTALLRALRDALLQDRVIGRDRLVELAAEYGIEQPELQQV